MNSVYVEGVYIGKAKNLGHGLAIALKRVRTGLAEDWSDRLLGLPLEGLRA
ncbi:MAG: hypothetical protein JWP80_4990 [Pseudomonas sp.]|nr:hypothetical protein [Pseudomonas sp.]